MLAAIRRQIKDAGLAPRVSLLGALPARELAARCAARPPPGGALIL